MQDLDNNAITVKTKQDFSAFCPDTDAEIARTVAMKLAEMGLEQASGKARKLQLSVLGLQLRYEIEVRVTARYEEPA